MEKTTEEMLDQVLAELAELRERLTRLERKTAARGMEREGS